jgi:hypothetical protein
MRFTIYIVLDNSNNYIIKVSMSHTIIQCVRKVAVHLQKGLEVMFTSVYIGLNPFNLLKPTGYVIPNQV